MNEKPASLLAIKLATLTMLVGVVVTIGLGIWQVQRLAWKQELIASIEQSMTAPPVQLEAVLAAKESGENIEYRRVSLRGTYQKGADLPYYSLGPEGPGVELITPMHLNAGGVVLVNRGYVPDKFRNEARLPDGPVELVAMVRTAEEPNQFTPDNTAALWYWRDIAAMRASFAGQLSEEQVATIPELIFAATPDSRDGWPRAGATRLEIPNNHLQYAVTWFAFAIILVVIFLLWIRKQNRLRLAP